MTVITPAELAQVMWAVMVCAFGVGMLGVLIGYALASNLVNLLGVWLWRRSRRWRRFHRAANKVLA